METGWSENRISIRSHNKKLGTSQAFFRGHHFNLIKSCRNLRILFCPFLQDRHLFEVQSLIPFLLINELKPQLDFKELHTKTMDLNVIKQAAVDYLVSSSAAKTYHSEILSTYIEQSNMKLSQLQPLMIEGLQKADLRYNINQDGSLTYLVKEDYAGSLK
jgi:hypothetical protein